MPYLQEVRVAPLSLARFVPVAGEARVREVEALLERARLRLVGRTVWMVNSTATGGGVAEMLPSLLGYARGAGIDIRWVVLSGNPRFFAVTKRLHHALHGSAGDGTPLDAAARSVYEETLHGNAEELLALVRGGDVVVLHDPQTAGPAPALIRAGALVAWRCHIGADLANAEVESGWRFLEPYLSAVPALVFSRAAYIPTHVDRERTAVIPPSIDPFSTKNQELTPATVRAILVETGLIEGPPGDAIPAFLRADGTPGRVDRAADVIRLGRAPSWETPLVVQSCRWDPLKDHAGVMHGFSRVIDELGATAGHLILAGPNVNGVADDPEAIATFTEVVAAWRALPHSHRRRVHLASFPMADPDETAAIVNALQRHAAVVVQKSLAEGFGLTVTEALWKGRPVIAGAVGGIQDQIEDGVHGLLVRDPSDVGAFAVALQRLLEDPDYAASLGEHGRERVRDEYLALTHLGRYAALLERVDR